MKAKTHFELHATIDEAKIHFADIKKQIIGGINMEDETQTDKQTEEIEPEQIEENNPLFFEGFENPFQDLNIGL